MLNDDDGSCCKCRLILSASGTMGIVTQIIITGKYLLRSIDMMMMMDKDEWRYVKQAIDHVTMVTMIGKGKKKEW